MSSRGDDAAHRRLDVLSRHATAGGAGGQALLDGQVAIVTGAAQGIGRAVAVLFAQHGAAVVVSDLDAAKSDDTVATIKAAGGRAISFPGDVTADSFGPGVVKAAVDTFGGLNIIVNNAGYTIDATVHRMSDEMWHKIIDVHCTAPFKLVRAAAPHFRKKDGANKAIINISSTSGLHGNAGQANYATAKMGIVGFTKTIAKEWGAFGVRCNAVAFGLINTRLTKDGKSVVDVGGTKVKVGLPEGMKSMAESMIPLQRAGDPEEAAGGVLMMASPLASFITGHCLEVTGGAGI